MLVICATPLQTLIIKSMIREGYLSDFKLIYYTPADNPKHRHYYRGLAELASRSTYVCLDSRFPVHWMRFNKALRDVKARDADSIVVSNINFFYVQYAIRKYRYQTIFTFDDGTGNINPRSAFYQPVRRSPAHDVLEGLLRGRVDPHWIRRHVTKHYTIYPSLPNIVEARRVLPVDLFDPSSEAVAEGAGTGRHLRIFLGQRVDDLKHPGLSAAYPNIVRQLAVDEYLPHPRETAVHIGPNVIETHLIAEDYILKQAARYDTVTVYSLCSTALLNVRGARIRKRIVTYPGLPEFVVALYPYFEAQGCEFIAADPAGDVVTEAEGTA